MDNNDMNNLNTIEPEQPKDASKILSILSLVCYCLSFGGFAVISIVMNILFNTSVDGYSSGEIVSVVVSRVLSSISALSLPASIVLMIIARVKNPKNTMAKVMMWIWIATVIVIVILVIIAIAIVASACSACIESCPR